MTYKFCEIETNIKIIVHYDPMKPCRSPPGGFVLPTNTRPAPMQPSNALHFKCSTTKCHLFLWSPNNLYFNSWPNSHLKFGLSGSTITAYHFCIATICQRQPSPESTAPLEEETFPNHSPDSTLLYSSHVPEVVNSSKCSLNTAVSSMSFLDDFWTWMSCEDPFL